MVKKKIQEYISKTMRRVKHRKGFGVHSPFAYGIITEVIEEKLPYYAYQRMHRLYGKSSPMAEKQAQLLLRLANRFAARNIVELCGDGGYSLLPVILTDTRNRIYSVSTELRISMASENLNWLPEQRLQQVTFVRKPDFIDTVVNNAESCTEAQQCNQQKFDMFIVNGNPFKHEPEGVSKLTAWILSHANTDAIVVVRGIQPSKNLEAFWDELSDKDELTVTMDLFDLGLGVFKQNFFKQHYIVSF